MTAKGRAFGRGPRLALALLASLLRSDCRGAGLWPQTGPFPDAARIDVSWLGDGNSRVTGRPGAVLGSRAVLVACANSGGAALATSRKDGSFEAVLPALPGSWIVVKHDPTGAGARARWILPPFREPHTDVSMDSANTAPGAWLRVPPEAPPAGAGRPVEATGVADPAGVDFRFSGRMGGRLEPGGSVEVDGTLSVFASTSGARPDGARAAIDADLALLFDREGRERTGTGFYFSNILTPTGLPVQTKGRATPSAPGVAETALARQPGGRWSAPLRWSVELPRSLPAGTYCLGIRPRIAGLRPRGGLRASRETVLTRGFLCLAPFAVGRPGPPRLTWTLLTDVLGADGSRGTVAEEDRGDFELAGHVVTQSRVFIVARSSAPGGEPIAYRLEPYLPMVSQGDRHAPSPPAIAFKFPSGSLRVVVRRPDGKTDVLGPVPFSGARGRSPATAEAVPLNGAGGGLVDVFQLTTGSDRLEYRFPLYGRYEIEMTGEVSDVEGRRYAGGGRYVVFVAERLDLEPATLPMTPLQVGDALNPGLTILPGVPADVDVSVRLLRQSDPARGQHWSFRGRANRFGRFAPPRGARPAVMSEPGEFIVESTARYVDPRGVWWMGASRWGQVVATPGAPVLAHGRRGRVHRDPAASLWFESSRQTDGGHLRFPYASGDVAWQTGDDCHIPAMTLEDREGLVEAKLRRLFEADSDLRAAYRPDDSFEGRRRAHELPLVLVSSGPLPPASDPGAARVLGYFYGGVERPGERVREVVSDDRGIQDHGYWFFDEPYAMQPGIGPRGDLPGDFKFLYGGAAFRDLEDRLNRYAIYGALWVHLPDGDPRGTRVFPPFQGSHGGPSGGPLFRLNGKDVDGFVVPLAARPGSILESGDTFSFSAAIAPPLPASVAATITGPGGFRRRIAGRANAAGYFYRPDADFVVRAPGVYRVSATATFDAETSAGPTHPPYPTGSILGATDGAFEVYVVDERSPRLTAQLPVGPVQGAGPIRLRVAPPAGASGTLRYTIAMPGFHLRREEQPLPPAGTEIVYDPQTLSRTFPNIDVPPGSGLADTVWVNALVETAGGRYHAAQITLQGPDVYAP